jgi:ATP/maltotriose-dependent transcriptional regulator MalT
LRALTGHAGGDLPAALAALERALTLAEPEGYVRVFAGEGPAMTSLLRRLARQRPTWDYVRRLLHARARAEGAAPLRQATPAGQGLVEPLSERELQVLRLLASDLDGPGIARELTVSLNTLRTHTRNIYAKLGVTSRRAAVRQAAELNLLSRTRDR